MLLLRSTGAAWTLEQLGARLYLPAPSAGQLVDDLEERGLAVHLGDNAQYLPKSEGLAQAVDELAEMYGRCLIEVTQLIHSANERKALRFAEAFFLRKDS